MNKKMIVDFLVSIDKFVAENNLFDGEKLEIFVAGLSRYFDNETKVYTDRIEFKDSFEYDGVRCNNNLVQEFINLKMIDLVNSFVKDYVAIDIPNKTFNLFSFHTGSDRFFTIKNNKFVSINRNSMTLDIDKIIFTVNKESFPMIKHRRAPQDILDLLIYKNGEDEYIIDNRDLLYSLMRLPIQLGGKNIRIIYNIDGFENSVSKKDEITSFYSRIFQGVGITFNAMPVMFEKTTIHNCIYSGERIYLPENELLRIYLLSENYFRRVIGLDGNNRPFYIDYRKRKLMQELQIEYKRDDETGVTYVAKKDKIEYEQNINQLDADQKVAITKVNNYSFRPKGQFFVNKNVDVKNPDDELYFGVELEIDGGGHHPNNVATILGLITKNKPRMYATSDASLRNGFEFKTIPSDFSSLMSKDAFDFEEGFAVAELLEYTGENDTSGLHIHVSQSFFERNLRKLVAEPYSEDVYQILPYNIMLSFIERNWIQVVKFTRRSFENIERWARNPKKSFDVSGVSFNGNYSQMREVYNYCRGNRGALAVKNDLTFEFRIFRGTLDPRVLRASIQFVNNLCKLTLDKAVKILNNVESVSSLEDAFAIKMEDVIYYETQDMNEDLIKYYEERVK